MQRLDQFLCHHAGLTRSTAKIAIKNKHVMVNKQLINNINIKVNTSDFVYLNQQLITPKQAYYFMVNKPKGYVCSHHNEGKHRSILNLIDLPDRQSLHAAGRLDQDTTGLVLLTDQGQWSHKITHPRQQCAKQYQVYLEKPITTIMMKSLQDGVLLHGEKKLTAPAKINIIQSTEILLTITEGKYHQVKRMFAAVGNHVVHLHRLAIGTITLDTHLALGEYRPLTPDEIELHNASA